MPLDWIPHDVTHSSLEHIFLPLSLGFALGPEVTELLLNGSLPSYSPVSWLGQGSPYL